MRTSGATTSAGEAEAVRAELPADRAVRLHPLRRRRDGDEWIIGRLDCGEIVALPEIGIRIIDLLDQGMTIGQVWQRLMDATGRPVNVERFVGQLVEMGFVAAIGDHRIDRLPVRKPTLGRLQQRHVRWVQHPVTAWLVGALIAAGLVRVLLAPDQLPGYRELVWSRHGSLVLATTFIGGWALLLLHEGAHLAAARALGIPARIRLGTRLQFLVAQTDVSGVELFPRRNRMTAYLAGMAVNLAVASASLLAASALGGHSHSAWHHALSVLTLLALVPLPFQFLVFMRTDLFFVLEDLTGCRALHADGRTHLRFLLSRALAVVHRGARPTGPDPTADLPRRERAAVRWYSGFLAVGTCGCLTVMATVTLPTDLTLLAQAAEHLRFRAPAWDIIDSGTVFLVLGGVQILWITARFRDHRRRRRTR